MNFYMRFLMVLFLMLAAVSSLTAQTGTNTPKDLYLGGQPSAPVRIEVFSDYQCPTCREFYLETIRPLLKEYGRDNKVCVLYHDFPLRVHKYAYEASRYAMAASRLGQDQWLRVHEALYVDQLKWTEDGKIEAVMAGVLSAEEMTNVKNLLKDPSIDQTIDQKIASAKERQVVSTPTFFLFAQGREQKVVGKISYPVLKNYLDRLLK
ncbi:MAG: thioredoxin domain-containing protein [Thermodesulfobacteriota bacterium]|jgi:protein-disulfide isomerase